MTLRELVETVNVKSHRGPLDRDVLDVVCDSRKVREGSLFVAVTGLREEGHRFIPEAVNRGAVGLVVNREMPQAWECATILVSDTREALGLLSSAFYGHPSSKLRLVGITGTNGKTTTTYLVRAILSASRRQVGLLGTISYESEGEKTPAPYTTPEAPMLQNLLAQMRDRGMDDVVMEVSSHALELGRVIGCEFDCAVFTNLTQDHLDFHISMEQYFHSKEKLFRLLFSSNDESLPRRAIINHEDAWGKKLIESDWGPTWSYGLTKEAEIWADEIEASRAGIRFVAHTPSGSFPIDSPLLGHYNVFNLLAAIGVGLHFGIAVPLIQRGVSKMSRVPGRFDPVEAGQDFAIIVDYAHTESALRVLLEAVRHLTPGRLIVVFGCGGDRDHGKRVPMGQVAGEMADIVILTSDNPRSEEPNTIIEEISCGVQKAKSHGGRVTDCFLVPDRREAIHQAIGEASKGDAVVIAGKGHETYQIFGSERQPFDDREVALDSVRKR